MPGLPPLWPLAEGLRLEGVPGLPLVVLMGATAFFPGAGSPPAGDGGEGREAGLGNGGGHESVGFFRIEPLKNLLILEVAAAVAIGPLVPSGPGG